MSDQLVKSGYARREAVAKGEDVEPWTTVIDSAQRWYLPDVRGVLQYKDLVRLLVRRDFVAIYKQSLLGPIWFVLQPLLTTIVFTIVFGHVASIPTDGIAPFLFYFAGVICWQLFSAILLKTSDTFAANASIFSKVYFPRLVTPISAIVSNFAQFAIQLVVFLLVLLWFMGRGAPVGPTLSLLLLPLLLLQVAVLGLGIGLLVTALTTRFRDLTYLVGFGIQLWMYATPIVYPLSQIPDRWLWIAYLNPMAPVVQSFRHALLGSDAPSVGMIGTSVLISLAALASGLALFSRMERQFMDTI